VIFGYARCSTDETKQDVERQRRELREMGAEEIYWEYESGTKINRQELLKVLTHIKEGDTLVVTEVSRLTRSLKQLCEILDLAETKKLCVRIGTFTVDCRLEKVEPMTMAMLQMMGIFAQLEREMTVERIKSGLANARAKGKQLGRRRITVADIPPKVHEFWPMYKSGMFSKSDYAKICGVTRPTIYNYIALLTDN
jgi:DNA invertase Pin-like site-specific DNA recombinase